MTHLVVRPVLDVRVRGGARGLDAERAVLDRLGALWHERLVPALDEVFTEAAGPDEHVRIERLELDLGSIGPDDVARAFAEALRAALARELRRVPRQGAGDEPRDRSHPDGNPPRRADAPLSGDSASGRDETRDGPDDDLAADVLDAFLRTGRLPWWADRAAADGRFDLDQAVAQVLATPGVLAALVRAGGPAALRRLAWQARPDTLRAVLRAWTPNADAVEAAVATWRPIARALGMDAARVEAALWETALSAARPDLAARPSPEPPPPPPLTAGPATRAHVYAVSRLAEGAGREIGAWVEAVRAAPKAQALPTEVRAWLGVDSRLPSLGPAHPPADAAAPGDLTPGTAPSDEAPVDAERRNAPTTPAPDEPPAPDELLPPSAPSAPGLPEDVGDADEGGDTRGAASEAKRMARATEAPSGAVHSSPPVVDPDGADTGPLYVRDAGLVLLGPFLPAYLGTLGLLGEARTGFTSPAARRRGVALVVHLASGRFVHAEPDVLLAKLLCGHPLADPVEREITPSDAERDEAGALLAAVVGHWTALKNTSPEGLRTTFLARDGRLDRGADAWTLTVGRRGVDVLVDAVPWALGVVRLPWMERPITVTW